MWRAAWAESGWQRWRAGTMEAKGSHEKRTQPTCLRAARTGATPGAATASRMLLEISPTSAV